MRKGGSIVLVSSGLHLKGLPEHGTYAATKAAVRSFARTWAMELKDRGIRVNTLSPGAIDTPIIDGQFKTKEEADGARAFFAGDHAARPHRPPGRDGLGHSVPGLRRQQLQHRHRSRRRWRYHAGLNGDTQMRGRRTDRRLRRCEARFSSPATRR